MLRLKLVTITATPFYIGFNVCCCLFNYLLQSAMRLIMLWWLIASIWTAGRRQTPPSLFPKWPLPSVQILLFLKKTIGRKSVQCAFSTDTIRICHSPKRPKPLRKYIAPACVLDLTFTPKCAISWCFGPMNHPTTLCSKGKVLKNVAKNAVNSKTNIFATPRDFETFIPKRKNPSNSHQNDEGKENGLSTTPFLSSKN